jgi:hypothetical protein
VQTQSIICGYPFPLNDTPEPVKAWGSKFEAGTGWTFVTGNKPDAPTAFNNLSTSGVARREDHTVSYSRERDHALMGWRVLQMVGLIENVIAGKVDKPQTAKESANP